MERLKLKELVERFKPAPYISEEELSELSDQFNIALRQEGMTKREFAKSKGYSESALSHTLKGSTVSKRVIFDIASFALRVARKKTNKKKTNKTNKR